MFNLCSASPKNPPHFKSPELPVELECGCRNGFCCSGPSGVEIFRAGRNVEATNGSATCFRITLELHLGIRRNPDPYTCFNVSMRRKRVRRLWQSLQRRCSCTPLTGSACCTTIVALSGLVRLHAPQLYMISSASAGEIPRSSKTAHLRPRDPEAPRREESAMTSKTARWQRVQARIVKGRATRNNVAEDVQSHAQVHNQKGGTVI